ncbi:MAG TPA: hypothetical protein PKK26_12535 [Candidatus Wallbacteria bacterium]|nr:hypothetical protein [Candidatus Wallbacteria bacterium]
MDRTQLIQKKIFPITMIFFIAIAITYYAYVNFYVKQKLNAAQAAYDAATRIEAPQTQINVKQFEKSPRYGDLMAQLAKIEENIKVILPSIKNFGVVADQIQNLAQECDVEVINLNIFNPSETTSALQIYPMSIKLECKSTYKAFKKFLWCMENCTNTIFIDKLKIVSSFSEEKITYSYDLTSYIKK